MTTRARNHFRLAVGFVVAMACTPAGDDAGADRGDPESDGATDASSNDAVARDANAMSLRILFIGNSYTFVNDLPSIVRDALASAPEFASIEVDSATLPGASLGDLWDAGVAPEKIRTGRFTHVVVQGRSTEIAQYESFVLHAEMFATTVHDAGAELAFFETWPRRAGDPLYSNPEWPYRCPIAMLTAAKAAYRTQAWTHHGELAPIGEAWGSALAARPDIDLYAEDGTHPSIAGSWLAASVIVCTIAHRSANGLTKPAAVSASEAAFLVETADRACADWDAFDGGIDEWTLCPDAASD